MSRSILKNHIDAIEKCNDKETLYSILKDARIIINNNRSFSFFISKNKIITEKITKICLYNESIKESVYRLINNIENDILCECGNKCRFLDNNRGYKSFCGDKKCKFLNDKRIKSISKTFNDKYGGHPMKTNVKTLEKLKNSVNKKYGHDNIMTYLSKENLFNSPFRLDSVKKKIKDTFNDKYGGHPMQNDDVFTNNLKSRVKFKNYKLPSGIEIKLQGYEKFGMELLLEKYSEEDILYSVKEINEKIGIIYYYHNNKKCRYYSDFFVKSENKIYEVKSIWTYKANIEKNILKMNRCIELGFNFEFLIFDYKGNLLSI